MLCNTYTQHNTSQYHSTQYNAIKKNLTEEANMMHAKRNSMLITSNTTQCNIIQFHTMLVFSHDSYI